MGLEGSRRRRDVNGVHEAIVMIGPRRAVVY